jgi:hypothetical protein
MTLTADSKQSTSAGWLMRMIVLIVGVCVWVSACMYLKEPFAGDQFDDGQYLAAAQSLRAGSGYRLISRVGSPVATKYPPGVSVMEFLATELAPGPHTLAKDVWVARSLMMLSALGLAAITWQLLKTFGLDPWVCCLFSLALLLHPTVVSLTILLASDLTFAMLFGWFALRWFRRDGAGSWSSLAVDGLIAGAAMSLRGNGLVLPVAGVVGILLQRQTGKVGRLFAFALPVLLIVAVPSVLIHLEPGPRDTGNYRTEFLAAYGVAKHLWKIPVANLLTTPAVLCFLVTPIVPVVEAMMHGGHSPALRLFQLALLAVVLVGVIRAWKLRKLPPAVVTQVVIALAISMAWHCLFYPRFGLPLASLLIVAFAVGVFAISRSWHNSAVAQRIVAGAVLATSIIATAGAIRKTVPVHGVVFSPQSFPAGAVTAVANLTDPAGIIISFQPETIFLYTGRQGIPEEEDTTVFADQLPKWSLQQRWFDLAGGKPLYILVAPMDPAGPGIAADPFVMSCPFVVRQMSSPQSKDFWLGQVTGELKPEIATYRARR